jgi:carbon storage regulator
MLVLSRRPGESIVINHDIVVTVVDIGKGRIRLGVAAPGEVPVHRQEIHDALRGTGAAESTARDEEEDVRGREVILFGEDGSVRLLSVK